MDQLRTKKVAREIQRQLGILFQEETRKTKGIMISVTEVRLSPDLSLSLIHIYKDVDEVRRILDENGGEAIKIISKIENQEGVDNIDEIIDASYGILIARGDLGIEIDFEKIPAIQNDIVHRCILKKKPVIIATQMLHSMIHNPRPTRAEVSDVSSAILMNTDAVMLSGETTNGKYPVDAVKTMRRIIVEAEKHLKYRGGIKLRKGENDILGVTSYLAKYTVKSTLRLGVKAIITDVASGRCARNLSAYRGEAPIYACLLYTSH